MGVAPDDLRDHLTCNDKHTPDRTMNTKAVVDEFLSQRTLALVGISRGGKKFGNIVLREMTTKGYRILPVNPKAEEIQGEKCFSSLRELPERVGGVIVVVPPAETERVVREAHETGISRIWMQQGAESDSAVEYCRQNGMQEVHGRCILMFAPDAAFPHRAHRFFLGLFGKLPH